MRIPLSGRDWRVAGFLPGDWRFRRLDIQHIPDPAHDWIPATVPGHVQSDLLDAGAIPDPFIDRNSELCEWTSAREWAYELTFDGLAGPARLCFGGVDYECEVFLNGDRLGAHAGMFEFAFDVTLTGSNRLIVIVKAAPASQPQLGTTSLVRHWKPRFTYWWDFAARLVPQGIWEDVWLEVGETVGDVHVQPGQGEVRVDARADATVTILAPDGTEIASGPPGTFVIPGPQLWWPNGMGEQPLYIARVEVLGDTKSVRFGFKTLTVDDTFDFVANGESMFVKGWNWVPVHQLYGRVREDAYRNLIRRAKRAGCNLIRIWGGGLRERELFYDLCDEAGLLVWQDFIQSSSAVDNEPSTDPDYVAYAAEQARAMVRARRNHVSLAVWCAGNELATGAERTPLTDDHPVAATLRDVVAAEDPGRAWIVTTPTGPVPFADPKTPGLNVHGSYWHFGDPQHAAFYESLDCRFQGEVGTEGAANINTLRRTITTPWPRSHLWRHKGAWWYRFETVEDAFGELDDLETFIKASQYLQARGLRTIVRAAMGRAPKQRGVILWQLNEPWPNAMCTSVIDVFGHPKPAYWAVAHLYRGDGDEPAEDVSLEPAAMRVEVSGLDIVVAAERGTLHGVFVQTLTDRGGPYVDDGWRWVLREGQTWTIHAEEPGRLEVSALNAPAVQVDVR